MSDYAGFICHVENIRQAAQDARNLLASLSHDALSIQHLAEIPGLFMWRQQTLASAAILTMLEEFVAAGGGSRGARIILDPQGSCLPLTRHGPFSQWRFRPEREEDKNTKLTIHYQENKFIFNQKPLRNLPDLKYNYFEKNWPDFLCGKIYRKK